MPRGADPVDPNDPRGSPDDTWRPLPKSLEAEQAVLGAMMGSRLGAGGERTIAEVAEVLVPDDFYRPEHARLFRLLLGRYGQGKPTDLRAVLEVFFALDEAGQEALGGAEHVLALPEKAPTSANVDHYARIVRDHARRRRIITTLQGRIADVRAGGASDDPLEHRDRAVADLLSIAADRAGGWLSYDKVADHLDRVIAEGEASDRPRGISLGFSSVDDRFGRLLPGQVCILAARPAMGKTALALDIAEYVARHEGAVGFFSLEMSSAELSARSLAKRAGLSARQIMEGRIQGYETSVDGGLRELRDLPIFVDDRGGVEIAAIRSRARALQAGRSDLALLIVDYLQLVTSSDPRTPREQVVADTSRGLKALAKELGVPVLALAQLNRAVHDRKDPRPILSDLRESGSIEQDADKVLFIHRHAYYFPDDPKVRKDAAELICAKNRSGATGTADLQWDAERTTFKDETRQEVLLGRGGGR